MKNQQDKSSGLEILPKNKKIKTILILVGLSLCDFCTSICMKLLNSKGVEAYEILFDAFFLVLQYTYVFICRNIKFISIIIFQ